MTWYLLFADYDSQTAAAWWGGWGCWAAAIAAILVFCAAIFQDKIRAWFIRPSCQLDVGSNNLFFQAFHNVQLGAYRQIRLRIQNDGNAPARFLEVHLLKAFQTVNGIKSEDPHFVPVRLCWTHGGSERTTKPYFAQGTSVLADFGTLHGASGRTVLTLSTEVEAISIWQYGGGAYEFEVGVVCSDGFLFKGSVELSFDAAWQANVANANFAIQATRVWPIG